MPQLSITKIFHYEAAHALGGYDGLCANLHGHSYRLEVTVTKKALDARVGAFLTSDANDPKRGMLMDFSVLKKLVNQAVIEPFDHALVLNQEADAELVQILKKNYDKVICLPFQPSNENMVLYFAGKISEFLPEGITLKRLRLYETASSFTDWEN